MQIETAISSSRKELHSQGLRAPPCRLVEWTQLKDAFHHAASTTRACLWTESFGILDDEARVEKIRDT